MKYLLLSAAICSTVGCGNTEEPEQEARPLVYEGMSIQELENVLGQPESVDSTGKVFDVNEERFKKVEKWSYEKRTVVIIDDTVKNPNLYSPAN